MEAEHLAGVHHLQALAVGDLGHRHRQVGAAQRMGQFGRQHAPARTSIGGGKGQHERPQPFVRLDFAQNPYRTRELVLGELLALGIAGVGGGW